MKNKSETRGDKSFKIETESQTEFSSCFSGASGSRKGICPDCSAKQKGGRRLKKKGERKILAIGRL